MKKTSASAQVAPAPEKKKWIKPGLSDLSVNGGLPVKNVNDFFADVQAS